MDTIVQFLQIPFLGEAAKLWLVFIGIVITLLALDLGILHKDEREIGVQESLLLSAGYIGISLLFGVWVWWYLGRKAELNFSSNF